MTTRECKHCKRVRATYGRGLCKTCWDDHREEYPMLGTRPEIIKEEIAFFLSINYPVRDIPERLGLAPDTVTKYLKRMGVVE